MPNAVGLQPVEHEDIILTDGRDLDPGEKDLVSGSGILHLPDPMSLLAYDFPDRPIYVHFDTDIVNPLDAPAMNYVAPGGPRAEELGKAFRHIAQTGQVKAISVCCSARTSSLCSSGSMRTAISTPGIPPQADSWEACRWL